MVVVLFGLFCFLVITVLTDWGHPFKKYARDNLRYRDTRLGLGKWQDVIGELGFYLLRLEATEKKFGWIALIYEEPNKKTSLEHRLALYFSNCSTAVTLEMTLTLT